jgi:hypothetical protein
MSKYVHVTKDLVTGREIWLPTGNRISRAPTGSRLTKQKIPNLFEIFEIERKPKIFEVLTWLSGNAPRSWPQTVCFPGSTPQLGHLFSFLV